MSIEDVVELIVGDIEDEHDDEQAPGILKQSDGSFVADARASLEDVIAAVGKGFDVGEALNNVDTLAGYLVTQVGRVPVRGELVPGPAGFEFEVLDADPRRVKKVRIHQRQEPQVGTWPRRARIRARSESTAALAPRSHQRNQTDATAVSISKLAHAVVLSWGWRRAAIAFLAGAISALSLPPFEAWPLLFLTVPVRDLADRWFCRRPLRRNLCGRRRWLVFRVWVFLRRPVLDRSRLFGRCQDFRLAAADCGHRIAGRARDFHGAWICTGPRVMGTRTDTHPGIRRRTHDRRMAARPCALRLSLE